MCNNTVWLPWRDSSLTDGRRGHLGSPGQTQRSHGLCHEQSTLTCITSNETQNNSTVILENFWKDTPKMLVPILSRH